LKTVKKLANILAEWVDGVYSNVLICAGFARRLSMKLSHLGFSRTKNRSAKRLLTGLPVTLGILALSLCIVHPAKVAAGSENAQKSSFPLTSGTFTAEATLYGWPDNSPPGNGIAFPGLHPVAEGVGTFANPITFATDKSEIAPGTRIYIPSLQKYFIMEDDCVACDQDFKRGKKLHIDLWIGGNPPANANQVISCEDSLTQRRSFIVNPPSTKPVNTAPLFNGKNNTCF
jgi:hypothetical protein